MSFHEVRFPTDISIGASGGPERRTDIVTLGSGYEERNTAWAHSRRRYNAGYGVKSLDDIHSVLSFFEARSGKLYGFRWKDQSDFKSCAPLCTPSNLDQTIGAGDGVQTDFALIKTYTSGAQSYTRPIAKPVSGTVLVAVDTLAQVEGTDFTVDTTTGIVTFLPGSVPAASTSVTAGYAFDVPVRFDTDHLQIDHTAFRAGHIPAIPLIEIRV